MSLKKQMKKMGLSVLICAFALLIGGCTRNIEGTTSEVESDIASRSQETSVGKEKHFWVNRQGEVFDSASAPGGVDESLDTLVWIAFRGGNIISEDVSAGENAYILESNQVLEGSEEAEDHVWIRVVQEASIPQEGEMGQVSHKDYIFYVQGEDAYVGVQSAEDTERWTLLEMTDYGDWLAKEIDIYVRMTTGL